MKKEKWIVTLVLLAMVAALLAVLPFSASGKAADMTDATTGITLVDRDEDGYLEVGTADEMKALGNLLGANRNGISAELTADIDLNPGYIFSLDENGALVVTRGGTPIEDLSDLYAWPKTMLYGNMQGNGYTVRGLYQVSTTDDVGLFAYASSGEYSISNWHIANSYFKTAEKQAGALLGDSYSTGTVADCTVEAIVVSDYLAGGLAGYASTAFENCTANVTVIGKKSVGGITGSGGSYTGCVVSGTIKGTTENIGGIVGTTKKPIINCINRATILADGRYVGGIVGMLGSNYIQGCINEGAVSGAGYVGGIVGYLDNRETDGVLDSANKGAVSGTGDYVGGIAGHGYQGHILRSYNTGAISGGGAKTGGVAGDLVGADMLYCYNSGTVSGTEYTGGIAGYMYSVNFSYAYNTGVVKGTNKVGGIVGGTRGTTDVRSLLSLGAVTGNGSLVGAVIGEHYADAIGCYYLDTVYASGVGESGDARGVFESADLQRLQSGEIAYLLQRVVLEEDGLVWGQRLEGEEGDAYPLFGSTRVYRGYNGCTPYYSNTQPAITVAGHRYEDGFCVQTLADGSVCDSYETPAVRDGVYQIANAGNLYWFAAVVGGGYGDTDVDNAASAVLTANITVNPTVIKDGALITGADLRPWFPIGNDSFSYVGHFDGAGYTVRGLYCVSEQEKGYAGLFGSVHNGALIENVSVGDSYFYSSEYAGGLAGVLHTADARNCHVRSDVVISGSQYVGGLVGLANGYITHSSVKGSSFAGSATSRDATGRSGLGGIVGLAYYCDIENCVNLGTLRDEGVNNLGGIVGFFQDLQDGNAIIKNCLNAGTLYTAAANTGGIVGYLDGYIQNCVNASTVVYDEDGNVNIAALIYDASNDSVIHQTIYYDSTLWAGVSGIYADSESRAFGHPTADFATGEIAYLLGAAWGQTLGTDAYPTLGGAAVYGVFARYCDGTSAEYCSYSNDPDAVGTTGLHKENAHGYCTGCEVNISYASISAGRDLTVHYYVTLFDEALKSRASELSMRFTMNGKSHTVPIDLERMDGDEYIFSFLGIAPQCMSDNIAAELLLVDAVIASLATYSVKQNMESLIALYREATDARSTALVQLATDLLTYGAAAQIYKGHSTDALADADLDTAHGEALPSAEDSVKAFESLVDAPAVTFTGATVWFDQVNKIIVKLSDAEGVTVVVKRNGEIVEHTVNGTTVYTDGIYATDFAAVYTFELYVGDEHVQTFTYSVASYVYAMMNKTEGESAELNAMASLARALYRYGVSAGEYLAAVNAEK